MSDLRLRVVIERKDEQLPAFVVVPEGKLAPFGLTGTTTVEGTLDGVSLGRRSLRRLDDRRWFVELRQDHLRAVGKSTGERATLVLGLAATELPSELRDLIASESVARACWDAKTDAQKRMVREHVLSAKTPATRARRAHRALLPVAPAPSPPVKGLPADPREIVVRIVGRRLPGRTCGPYSQITVSLAQKPGRGWVGTVPADEREARWDTPVEVRAREGRPAFRGPAVNGPTRESFLYLTWVGCKDGGAPAMFRRAKLRLDAVPPEVLSRSLESGLLVGRVGLTDPKGMPICASLRPPVVAWESS